MQARRTLVFTGDANWAREFALQQISQLKLHDGLWVAAQKPENTEYAYLSHKKIRSILGSEFSAIVYDALDDFHPDAFGAVTGTLKAGGILLLLLPTFSELTSRFMQRLVQIINNDKSIKIIRQENSQQHSAPLWQSENASPHIIQTTPDQLLAIAAVKKVASGHRRRPLVLTADRGRGKSAALGIAAKDLLSQRLHTILVTAPARKSAEIIFKHAGDAKGIMFVAPDELVQTLPKADLLLVDEAAAIPAPLLAILLKHYARIVFSSTQHGYEGTGRGFEIRFKQELNQQTANWKALHLHTPIRWAKGDPLEKFVFKALLLNASQLPNDDTVTLSNTYRVEKINRDDLLKNEHLLSQLFGLLVTAHYQTKPSDLQYLLDNTAVSIYLITQANQVLATALTVTEGGFDELLAHEIYAGRRRPKGHLIPQSLAFHAGMKTAAQLTGERIIRIAVCSSYQRRGLATQLIQAIINDTKNKDYIGVSFAASVDMLNFWEKQHFKIVRLGLTRDASSGAHSAIELLPLSTDGKRVFKQLRSQFRHSLAHLLSGPLRYLEIEIIEQLLKPHHSNAIQLVDWQWQALESYATTHRGYEVCMTSLWEWLVQFIFHENFLALSQKDRSLLIAKILQKKSWKEIVENFKLTGKKVAQRNIKIAVLAALNSYR